MTGPTREGVKRLALEYNGGLSWDIQPHPNGDYVRYSDYAALNERLEAAEAELNEARAAYLAHKKLRIEADQRVHESRAREAAAWEAAAKRCDEIARHEVGREAAMMKAHATYFRALTPTDATTALTARLDAAETRGWNAAIEAAESWAQSHARSAAHGVYVDGALSRALRRNTETTND